MKLRTIIQEILLENKQLADKLYFNTKILSQEDKNIIYNITHGDNTTKLISDIYAAYKDNWNFREILKNLPLIHNQLLNYNPNVFPIKDYDILNSKNINNLYYILIFRNKIINNIRQLPSIAVRNLKNDIRTIRDYNMFDDYNNDLENFMMSYSLLGNRDITLLNKIHNKMFKSNITIDDLNDFVKEKENLLGGKEFTVTDIINMVDNNEDMEIIFNYNNVLVLKIYSAEAIKEIGCNSFWCFTYGRDNYRNWSAYNYNGMVYVIIDFKEKSDSPNFMYTLIKPLEKLSYYSKEENEDNSPLYDMANENYYNPYIILTKLVGKQNIKMFNFDE